MSGRRQIFELLASEDINGNNVDLGVTVLSSLGGRHFDDLAWATLDDNVTTLPQSGTLHRVGLRGAGVGGLEVLLMLQDERACQYPGLLQWSVSVVE